MTLSNSKGASIYSTNGSVWVDVEKITYMKSGNTLLRFDRSNILLGNFQNKGILCKFLYLGRIKMKLYSTQGFFMIVFLIFKCEIMM